MIASSFGRFVNVARNAALVVAFLVVRHSIADDTTPTERAQALFDEARLRMKEQKYEQACALFAESQALDPGGGTILNLAICHEHQGKFATALKEMRIALEQAKRDERTDRIGTASKHIAVLETKASFLNVLRPSSKHAPVVTLTLDSIALSSDAYSHPIAVDPGQHVVHGRTLAGNSRTWIISVGDRAERYEVDLATVIQSQDQRIATSNTTQTRSSETQRASRTTLPTLSRRANQPFSGNAGKRIGLSLVGGGLASAGVGAYWAYVSHSRAEQSDRKFDGHYCTNQSCVSSWVEAKRAAHAADAFLLAGAITTSVGLYFALAPFWPKQAQSGLLLSIGTSPRAALLNAECDF